MGAAQSQEEVVHEPPLTRTTTSTYMNFRVQSPFDRAVVTHCDAGSRRELTPGGWTSLLQALDSNLEGLEISRCSLNFDKAAAIGKAVEGFTGLKKFVASGNPEIEAEGWTFLLQAVNRELEEINFAFCKLTKKKATAIGNAMADFTALKKVSFLGNWDLEPAGWTFLLQAVNRELEQIDFSECGLTGEKALAIGNAMVDFKALKNVNLRMNRDTTPAGWTSLLQPLGSKLEDLSIRDCALNNDKAEAIGKAFEGFTGLKKFDASGNKEITPAGWTSMLQALDSNLEDLNINGCSLNTEKAEAIGKAVEGLTGLSGLKKFRVSHSEDIEADGWTVLLQAMSRELEEIDFTCCELTGEKASAIGNAMAHFTALKKVSFAGVDLGPADWSSLLGQLSPAVEDLNLFDCRLSDEEAEAVGQAISGLTSLKKMFARYNEDSAIAILRKHAVATCEIQS